MSNHNNFVINTESNAMVLSAVVGGVAGVHLSRAIAKTDHVGWLLGIAGSYVGLSLGHFFYNYKDAMQIVFGPPAFAVTYAYATSF